MNTIYGFPADHLSDTLSVANTPGFLITHFRVDPTVQALAKKATGVELEEALKECIRGERPTLDQVTLAYAYLVARSLQDPEAAVQLTTNPLVRKLAWAPQIVAHAAAIAEKTNTVAIQFTAPTPYSLVSSATSNTFNNLNLAQ